MPHPRRRRGPVPGATFGPSPAAAAARAAAGALETPINVGLAERGEQIRRVQRAELNDGRRQVTQALNLLAEEYSQREDVENDFAGEHDARARVAIDGILGKIEDDDVRAAVEFQADQWAGAQSHGLRLKSGAIASANRDAVLGELLDAHAARFGLAPTNLEREQALAGGLEDIAVSLDAGEISEADAIELKATFRQNAAGAYARNLINRDPVRALSELRDPNHGILKVLDGTQREMLVGGAAVAIRSLQTNASLVAKAQFDAQLGGFIQRTYNPQLSDQGVPTVPELNDALGNHPVALEHMLKLVAAKASGKDINVPDYNVINELYLRVHDPERALVQGLTPITDDLELVPFLGAGLTTEEFGKLQADLKARANPTTSPEEKAYATLKRDFLSTAKRRITGAGAISTGTNEDERKYYLWRSAFEFEFQEGLKKGLNPREMLDPKSKSYLGGTIETFRRAEMERLSDLSRLLSLPAGPVDVIPSAIAPVDIIETPQTFPPMNAAETPEAYLERIGEE